MLRRSIVKLDGELIDKLKNHNAENRKWPRGDPEFILDNHMKQCRLALTISIKCCLRNEVLCGQSCSEFNERNAS